MIRRASIGWSLLLLAAGLASAQDAPAPGAGPAALPAANGPAAPAPAPKPPPPTPEQAADAVLAAVAAKDDAALEALAGKDDPDPWLVADELIRRGQHDAADAFGRAAPRADTEALPAYVASRRGTPDDPARRERLARANEALGAGKPAAALDALGPEEPGPLDDVVGVRLAMGRGLALASGARADDAAAAYRAGGEAAERIGWLARATRAVKEAGRVAFRARAFAVARELAERELSLLERRGDREGAATALGNLAAASVALEDHARALPAYERARAAWVALGNAAAAATALANVGGTLAAMGEYPRALPTLELARTELKAVGDWAGWARASSRIGSVQVRLGEFASALRSYQSARDVQAARGDTLGAAKTLHGMGTVHLAVGDYAEALDAFERARPDLLAAGARAMAATTLASIGSTQLELGDLGRAVSTLQRARAELVELGDRAGAAWVDVNLGNVHAALGDYARALSALEEALAVQQASGDVPAATSTLLNLGNVYAAIGDDARALTIYERTLTAKEGMGDKAGAARTLGNIGVVHQRLGDPAKALEIFERARAAREALGDRAGADRMLGRIGVVHLRLGDAPKALAILERVLAAAEARGDREEVASMLHGIGSAYRAMGRPVEARASLERSIRAFKALRAAPKLSRVLAELAELHLREGDSARAAGRSREAMREVESTFEGLGEEEAAQVRARATRLYEIGAAATAREGDAAEALAFLESGRAGALLDAMGKRDLLRWKAETLSAAVRAADVKARAAERAARTAYETTLTSSLGDRRAIAGAARALDEALDERRAVQARIEREGKRGAGLFYPRARPVEEIQASLDDGDALVLYGLCLDEALALVVTASDARVAVLGRRADLEAGCEALDCTDSAVDVEASLATLRKVLVAPLALGAEVKRVLVSPEGPLGYVPFGALFDVPVAMTPSGTTHVLLREEEREPGEGVLALGDPDYAGASDGAQRIYFRGKPLLSLPATKAEAEAVGTTTLLGPKASEDGLRAALAERKRWRAVHFACHGLVDPERPTLSSLALSRGGEQDGFLTALEVLRTPVPADLAVLSACETGKGKIVGGEGIVGLTRAFMYAGSPRVICSLWKVDDEATRALMTKFYELWNPKTGSTGVGTAEALRAAQEHVRSQEKWKHPYYWAAWVLWGLPS